MNSLPLWFWGPWASGPTHAILISLLILTCRLLEGRDKMSPFASPKISLFLSHVNSSSLVGPVINYYLSVPHSDFIMCAAKMELGPGPTSPLLAGTALVLTDMG